MEGHLFRYFMAAGRSLAIIEQFARERAEAVNRLHAFAEKHGCKELYGGSRIRYAQFAGDLPEGWRGMPREARPDKRSAKGKEIAREMAALTIPDSWEFSRRIGTGMVMTDEEHASGRGNVVRAANFEKIGNRFVIKVPLGRDPLTPPPGAVPLRTSEYFQLKEEQEELEAMAAKGARQLESRA